MNCKIFLLFYFICLGIVNVACNCPVKCFCQSVTTLCSLMNLQHVPTNIENSTTLLDLRYNNIKQIGIGSFEHLTKLSTLLLSNNAITTVSKDDFRNLEKLQVLHLQKNTIETVEYGAFSKLRNLKQLFLHNNNLKTISIEIFPEAVPLENLRLDNNPLHCTCDVFWVIRWLYEENRNSSIQVTGVCSEPFSLRGKVLHELDGNLPNIEISTCRFPRFTVMPQSTVVESGKEVTLKCGAKGYRKPRITWRLNGIELDLKNKNYKFFVNELRIESASKNDEGIYECFASNDAGSIRSNPAAIKLKSEIPNGGGDSASVTTAGKMMKGSVFPTSIVASEGKLAQINCVVEGSPNFPVLWFKNNLILREIPSKLTLLNNGSVILSNLELEDSGKYDCITTEPATFIFGSSELIVNAAPVILSYFPQQYAIGPGTSFELQCLSKGYPTPVITWFKNDNSIVPTSRIMIKNGGSTLNIENVVESDSGVYKCLAQNLIGSDEQNTEIRVKRQGPRAPRIIIKPFDIDVPQFSSIEIPCKIDGDPIPRIQWLKNNKPIQIDAPKFRLSINSLRIRNMSIADSGVYTCIVSNIHGNDTASGIVTVIGNFFSKNEDYILQAHQEAKLDVERGINATLNHLFAQRNSSKSPEFLMKYFRYPDEIARNILKPADVYGRTLSIVRRHILSGLELNITDDFFYKELLTPTQLELVANLSGCVPHLLIANCSDTEFHSKYSTIDGTCNNLQNPMWGSSYTAFRRILKPIYENGFSHPVGWNKGRKYYGFPKPPARLVSTTMIRTNKITPDEQITHMVMQWGQFLDHDIDHALPSTTAESWEGLDCKKTCAYSEPCFPMEVPSNDPRISERRCMDFIRSSAVCGSDTTSVFFNNLHPREQLNQLTSYIDGSQVYGFVRDRSFLLRELRSDLGLLRGGIVSEHGKAYLPTAGQNEVDCRRDLSESTTGCLLAGDIRVNEQVGLLAIQTIWLREHNRLATELRKINPHWSGDTLFYEARKIAIAEMQHITYDHWLPLIVGEEGYRSLGQYNGYDPMVDASISNEFATAALRIGHTIINPELARLDQNFKTIPQGNLSLGKAFFSPWRLVEEGGVDPIMRGLFVTPAKKKMPNQNLNEELIEKLFTAAHAVPLDLAAMNIQRGRDHGLPGYLEYRKFCNLSTPENFDNLKFDIQSADVRHKLEMLYGHPGNIDVWVGGISEDQFKGSLVGPLFRCLLLEQFRRLRDGDRFWYEHQTIFTGSQVNEIKKVTLSRILCDNGDNISQISKNVFLLPHLQKTKLVPCSQIPKIDLKKWRS